MRFANIYYESKNAVNFGDQIQLLAIDHIYEQVGIPLSEVVYIDKFKTADYDGEPVILPINMPLSNYRDRGMSGAFSDKIKPLFIGLTFINKRLTPEDIDFYKKNEPVGCRDEYTYQTLKGYGIDAYLGGCITASLPLRKNDPEKQKTVFFIDPPAGLEKYIPEKLKQNVVFDTHVIYEGLKGQKEAAKKRYQRYADEAMLVVTNRMHGSVPCMAMGIPVILANEMVSFRFGWLESLLKIYTPDEYASIDWDPQPVIYEEHKKLLIRLIGKRLKNEECRDEIREVHEFYMNRDRKPYIVASYYPIKKFIDEHWKDKNFPYRYSIWALTTTSEMTVDYIQENYPNAKLVHVYDKKNEGIFRGVSVEQPENIKNNPDETVFVTSVAAYKAAKTFFAELKRPEDSYVLSNEINNKLIF